MARDLEISCVCFEGSALVTGSAEEEVYKLSADALKVLLSHLTQVLRGQIDPLKLQSWRDYQGIPLILVEYAGELMIYASELRIERRRQELKISILFGGARAKGFHGYGYSTSWDGSDETLWAVVEERCRHYFTFEGTAT